MEGGRGDGAREGGKRRGRERGRAGWRDRGTEGRREGGREGEREGGREGGREAGREGEREGGREDEGRAFCLLRVQVPIVILPMMLIYPSLIRLHPHNSCPIVFLTLTDSSSS